MSSVPLPVRPVSLPSRPLPSSPRRRALIGHFGGDAPGMNAALLGFATRLEESGWRAWGIENGWEGLTGRNPRFIPLNSRDLWRIHTLPGSVLKTGQRGVSLFGETRDDRARLRNALSRTKRFEGGLFVVGGEGSGWVSEQLLVRGACVCFAPGTIDNNIAFMTSIGFDSAVAEGVANAEKPYWTGTSCSNVMVAEMMGAGRGALPMAVAIGSAADFALIPEVVVDLKKDILPRIDQALAKGEACLLVVGEGADFTYDGGKRFLTPLRRKLPPVQRRIGETLARLIHEKLGRRAKAVASKYLVRGTRPLPSDVLRGEEAGRRAAEAIVSGRRGLVIPPDRHLAEHPLVRFFTSPAANGIVSEDVRRQWERYYRR